MSVVEKRPGRREGAKTDAKEIRFISLCVCLRAFAPSRPLAVSAANRSGLSSIYVVFLLTGLFGFVSLAVDVGRVRMARTELQTASDAASRAGADSLPLGTQQTIDNAVEAAADNGIIDADATTHQRTNPGLTLEPGEDLVFGKWDPEERTFTALDDSGGNHDARRTANAVHITGRRIKARGSAVPLIFAPIIGVFSSDLERESTAYITGGPSNFGFIGLSSISATGAVIDSMIDGQNATGGGVASDGDISLGTSDVYGDARAGIGHRLTGGATITGWQANLDYALSPKFPAETTPNGATTFNPPNNGDWILPPNGSRVSNDPNRPRVYVVDGINLTSGRSIRIRGYVTLYVEGDIAASTNTLIENTDGAPTPSRLQITVVGSRTVTLGGTAKQYLHLYAPRSMVTIRSNRSGGGFYGWIVSRRLSLQSGSRLHYDETRDEQVNYKITLVQ